ncbi:ATP synthase F0 subunit B [Geotalea sp. SG265]|uniref:ATP synthase F0 subunit B n=1 Tax=Geotalea sp. SG265 TaxID=2922867 RepID=UPI001FAF79A6
MISLDFSFVFQLVNFLLLMLILNIFLFKPIRKVLSERNAEISGAKAKSASVDQEVQEKQALYETRMREIKSRATDERSGLRKEAQAEEAAILDKARKDAADTLSAIKSRVAKESADARQLLKEQALNLSSEICEKVLGRSI